MNQMFFHIVFVIVFTSFVAIRMIYHRKARQTRGKVKFKEGRLNSAFRLMLGISSILLLFAYMFNPNILEWAQYALPEWAQWLGVVLGVASISLIGWVQWALGANFSGTLHVRADHTLVTHGPYRWVRHPMYTAFYVLEIAILLLTANWFVGGVLLIGQTMVIVNRIRNEENAMIEKFGDAYREYIKRTGRFLPRHLIGDLR